MRSRKLRALLWYAAEGRCRLCGQPLGVDWQADHIVPWVRTHRTNVHEMQALCAECNRRKGDKVALRKHQTEAQKVSRDISGGGSTVKQIIAYVTPGGGKSGLPVIIAKELIPYIADAICWVVPRITLRKQAEKSFQDRLWKIELPHNMSIRASTNEANPCRGHQGYVTTYQAIGQDPTLHSQEFDTKRYILFLDEPHHVERDSIWHKALQPLVDKARFVVYASGTFERGDGKHIAFIPYCEVDSGSIVDYQTNEQTAVIRYTRRAALAERAIVPLHFEVMDGRAEWVNGQGEQRETDSIASAGEDTPAALFTALKTQYALELLHRTVKSWKEHRRIYTRAKLLVVAPRIEFANKYLAALKEEGVNADIATSDDSQLAQVAIDRFKGERGKREIDALVTVMMAYEGLDVPCISHIACLTNIRSKPWLEQCFARACRVDSGKSYGYIFGPDDEMFRKVMEEIKAEQEPFVKDRPLPGSASESLSPASVSDGILPLASQLTRERATSLSPGEDLGYEETATIMRAMGHAGIAGVSPLQIRNLMLELGVTPLPAGPNPVMPNDPILTPSEQEANLRDSIERYIRKYAYSNNQPPKEINKHILEHFGKPRKDMTAQELMQVWAYVQSRYPGMLT
ncbi:MAG: DEAD/DEAH box helicase family protein [Chloroflexota bacterium]